MRTAMRTEDLVALGFIVFVVVAAGLSVLIGARIIERIKRRREHLEPQPGGRARGHAVTSYVPGAAVPPEAPRPTSAPEPGIDPLTAGLIGYVIGSHSAGSGDSNQAPAPAAESFEPGGGESGGGGASGSWDDSSSSSSSDSGGDSGGGGGSDS